MSRAIVVLILCFILIPGTIKSQNNPSLIAYEDSLLILYQSILKKNPFDRETASNRFYNEFYHVIEKKGSFSYSFSKLKNIGKIYSSDHTIRIYSWNIPFDADDNLYFGILHYYSKSEKKYLSVKLNEPLISKNSNINTWQGSLCYEIINTKYAGKKYYTLLSLDLHNSLSNKKRIDVIAFDDENIPYFCEKLIFYNNKLVDNLEFQYNEKVIMSLRYNKDAKMIVFDHLSPNKSSLNNNYEFYGPDFTYDGLKFEKGIWVHLENIDITN
jgi:hypothetical protein